MVLPNLAVGEPIRVGLQTLADAEHVAYLLGAGASAAAHLPNWTSLLRNLLTLRKLTPAAVEALVAGQDPMLAAEAAFRPTDSPATRQKRVYKALYGTTDPGVALANFAPTPIHLAVAADAVRRGHQNSCLMTLNYDDLLEEAVAVELKSARSLTDAQAIDQVHGRGASTPRRRTKYEVHHLHGLLARDKVVAQGDDLILRLSDYHRLLSSTVPWQRHQLQEARQSGPLLLLGTSYGDPDMRLWLDELKGEADFPIVLVLPRQGLGLSREDLEKTQETLKYQWKRLGVQCLILEDYAEVAQALRDMAWLVDPDYRTPHARAADVLNSRTTKFSTAQKVDAKTLVQQTRDHLEPVVGQPANLTLWLLDPFTNELVRWASNDRTYLTPDDLLRIPATLESPWIASQAVCFGTETVSSISVTTNLRGRDPEVTGRWQAVAGRPILAVRPGGPAVTVGAITAASPEPLDDSYSGELNAAVRTIATHWEGVFSRLRTP